LKRFLLSLIVILFSFKGLDAQLSYKDMMYDNSYNFYEVCKVAEAHFANIDISAKGSGWKGYQRWRNANESKYYPDGDRSQTDPYFVANEYKEFVKNNPQTKSLFPNGWKELGPLSIDSLTGHYSAGYGRIEDLYVDPFNPNKIYVGSRSGGFWKSLDGGQTWTGGSTDFLFASGVNAIDVDPTNSNHVLINLRNSRNAYTHGVYESFDSGDTWIESNFNPVNIGSGGLGSSFRIFKIAYHPTIPNLVFVGSSRGLYRSDDNLATWTRLLSAADLTQIAFHPTDPNIMYVLDTYSPNGLRDYVLKSVDQGLTFNQSNAIPGNNNSTGRLSVSPICPNCVYFASTDGVWKSLDTSVNYSFLSNPGQSCGGFAVNDQDTTKMIYGYVDLERTFDGGQNFEKTTWWSLGSAEHGTGGFNTRFPNSQKYVHADLRIAKCINGVFYVGTDGMFAKSTDNGVSWEHLSEGLGVRENYKLGASQSNHFRSVSGSQDNGTSINTENGWVEFYGADGMEGLIHPLNDDWIIGSVQYGSRRRTLDGGLSQSGVNAPGQNGSGSGAWEAPIAYAPNDQMRLYNFSDSIYVSENFAEDWTYRGVPLTFTGSIRQAAIAENNSDFVVISEYSKIERSTDAGATFTSIKNNLPNYTIEDIAFHPDNDSIIFVCYGRYNIDNSKVFMSTNGGASWTNITYNLGNMPIRSVVVDHTNDHNIYLGAEIGVYTMPMNGNNWTLYNPNLPNTTIEELEVVYGSNTLRAATWGRGLFEFSLVGRNDYPAIMTTKITDLPTFNTPKFGIDQFVTSTISYDQNLSNVYVEWSANAPTFGNVISMSNISDSTWVSDQALPNLTVGSKMYFKVFAVGNNSDSTETYKFMYTVQPFDYCATLGTLQYDGNVTLVNLGDINRASGKLQPYTNYTFTDSTEVIIGLDYDLTVNLNTDNGNFTYYGRAWIDWNRDADFDDPGEMFDLGTVSNDTNAPTTLSPFSVNVPTNALVGPTTMRVACRYNSYPDLCDTGFDGEVEDYRINVVAPPNTSFTLVDDTLCLGESVMITYSGVSANSLNWTLSNGIDSYSSTATNPSILMDNSGNYTISLDANINGQVFQSTIINALTVLEPDTVVINVTTCDAAQTGSTTQSYINQFGCDSVVTITRVYDNIFNTLINYVTEGLIAEQTGVSYQWLDCENNYAIIPGEQEGLFSPSSNGTYSVMLTNASCSDTSSCIQVTNVGIKDGIGARGLLVYPNPTSNSLTIEFTENQEAVLIEVFDLSGSQILQLNEERGLFFTIDLGDNAIGSYFIHITTKEFSEVVEVLKR
jgi:photosystem II stability/assembly factor-like uncharacterized protein